jgi:ssDNA-binding Zn-finger/Zn-ribbon topoisomerase 1
MIELQLTANDLYLLETVCKVYKCKCGNGMTLRYGKFGYFMGCKGYPKCKNNGHIIIHMRNWQDRKGKKYTIYAEVQDHIGYYNNPHFTDSKYKGSVVSRDKNLPELILK